MVLITHQKNIERLLKGTESKMRLIKRKQKQEELEFELENDKFKQSIFYLTSIF